MTSEIFQCPHCINNYSSAKGRDAHVRSIHGPSEKGTPKRTRGYPKCPKCKTATVVPSSTHPRAGEIPTILICAACGEFLNGTPAEIEQALRAERGFLRKEAREEAAFRREAERKRLEEKLARLRETGSFR